MIERNVVVGSGGAWCEIKGGPIPKGGAQGAHARSCHIVAPVSAMENKHNDGSKRTH